MRTYMRELLAATALIAAPGVAMAQDAASPAEEQGFGDIIVTAQRTDQKLQDVPVSVTAITAEQIDTRQILAPTDIARLVPNVKLDAVSGGSAGLKAYIRGGGVTDGGYIMSESEVALYINDIYNARAQGALVDFAEIERIEVVRGPQGVLYGRNASAGAINIITKTPSRELTGTVQAGFGSWNERRIKGYLSVPLSKNGDWAASINGMVRARDGGRQYNATLDKKVGAEDFHGGQFDLAYNGEAIKARLNLFYLNTDTDGQWAVNMVENAEGKLVPLSGSYRTVLSPHESYTKAKQYGGSLRVAVEYPGGTLTSTTGYSELKDSWFQDFSGGVYPSMIADGTIDRTQTPIALFDRESISSQWQLSQELQAAGEGFGGVLEYVGGIYYFHEQGDQLMDSEIFFAPSSTTFRAKTDAWAAYGQFSLNVAEGLQLQIGGRYTLEDKRLNAAISGVPAISRDSWSKFTPKLGVNYKVWPGVMLFATYSEGFKSGGYNGLASTPEQLATPFQPQLTRAYEAGVKADIGSTLRVNLAGFLNKIKDRQQTVNLGDGGFLIENYDVEIKGIELELAWRPVRGLQIWGNGALNDGKYTSSDALIPSLISNVPPSLPDYEFTVGADYAFDLAGGKLSFGADYNNRDAFFSTPDNIAIGAVKSMEILNAYVAYKTGPWDFQIAGKNLAQEIGWQTGFGFSVINPRVMSEPRRILGTVRYSF